MPSPDANFARAQREYENRMPPEAPEDCRRHGWEYDSDEPDVDECPDCLGDAEAYEDDAYDRWKDAQGDDERDEPDFSG